MPDPKPAPIDLPPPPPGFGQAPVAVPAMPPPAALASSGAIERAPNPPLASPSPLASALNAPVVTPARGAGMRGMDPISKLGFFRAFYNFMRDGDASFLGRAFIVFVAVYVVLPVDLVPELVVPAFGFLDDLGMAGVAAIYLMNVLGPYREGMRGVRPAPSPGDGQPR